MDISFSTICSSQQVFLQDNSQIQLKEANVFWFLPSQGYRVISVDIPRAWNNHEWIQAFEKFLDAIDVHHVCFLSISVAYFMATA